MPIAFTDAADFSGMTGKRELVVSDVVHKAFVSVDEFGTEAAAATGVVMGITSAPLDPATVTIDRPFIFLIRDIATGAVLFTGRVTDPS
jgi:serpin B